MTLAGILQSVALPGEKMAPSDTAIAAVQQDNASLAELALQGDKEAWNVLIARHNHRVMLALLARSVRIDRAKEIAQDAWIRLIEKQKQGRLLQLNLPGLAISQAVFLALDDARRNQTQLAAGDEPVSQELADSTANAEEKFLTQEQLQCARLALAKCSVSARQVFCLLYENPEISHAEVAQQVGLSLQRVRQIICEVRKQLRVALQGLTP
jgi:RNA polymerase sigma factor (sigma-70 family)